MTSEIRTNSLTSRAGLSTVTMTDSGPMFSGITTFVDNSGFTFGVGGGTSIFTPATNILTLGTNNTEKVRIDANGNTNITGVTTAANFKTGVSNLHNAGLTLTGGQLDVGSNIKIGTAGVVTATTFSGSGASLTNLPAGNLTGTVADARISTLTASKLTGALPAISGANLTGIAGITINNNANGRIITATGNADEVDAQTSLFFTAGSDPKLTISGTGHAQLNLTSTGGTDHTGINFGDSADINAGMIQYSNSNNAMQFHTNGGEKLRIDSSGRLGLGLNNPDTLFHIKDTSNSAMMRLESSSYSSYIAQIQSNNNVGNGSLAGNLYLRGQTGITMSGNNGTATQFTLDSSALTIKGTTDGVLNLDTSDSRGSFIRFQQNGTSKNWIGCGNGLGGHNTGDLVLQSTEKIIFKGNASGQTIREMGRFEPEGTTGGSFLVGTTTFGYQASNNTGHNLYYNENGTANEGFPWFVIVGYTAAAGNNFGPWVTNRHPSYGNVRFYVQADGTIRNYNGINGLCDEREKNSIVDAPNAWDYVKNWRMRKFKYNKDGLNPQMKWGIVAQEFEQVNPELVDEEFVTEGNPNVDDTTGEMIFKEQYGDQPPTKRKSVNDRQMMMIAIKALQEAMTKIETLEQDNIALRARVTNLEGN